MNSTKEIFDSMIQKGYSFAENYIVNELQLSKEVSERQYVIGNYFADFYFPKYNVVLEVDGKEYHSSNKQILYDKKRNEFMNKKGFTVLRVTASMAEHNPSGIISIIKYLNRPYTYFINSDKDIARLFNAVMNKEWFGII